MPSHCYHRCEYPPRQLPDGSWEGPYECSSQEDFSDSMPKDWEDEGPGPKVSFCEPIPMFDTTPRGRAWRRRQRELGRIPKRHVPYTLYSALEQKDGTWKGPYYTNSVDEYSDTIPNDWEEDQVVQHLPMATDPPLDTPLTQLEPEDNRTRTVGKRTRDQATHVDRMLVGDITYRGNNTHSRPAGKRE